MQKERFCMEYNIVLVSETNENRSRSGLEEEVNQLIKDGWKPQGGIMGYISSGGCHFLYQAMVKG